MTTRQSSVEESTTVDLSFVIAVRNDPQGLERCLESISNASAPAVKTQIIVVDNGSVDDTVAVAKSFGAVVLVVPHERVSSLRNRGTTAAVAPLVAFVDADHEIDRGWVAAALEVMSDETISAAGAPYTPPPDPTWVQRAYDGFRDHTVGHRVVDWIGSGNLVVRRQTFCEIGGFDVSLEACEDVDLCRRIRQAGGVLVSDSRLRTIHHGDPRTLSSLFKAELWRGRDNLRVSLRERITLRRLPSMAVPVAHLVLLVIFAGALAGRHVVMAGGALAAGLVPSIARAIVVWNRTAVPVWRALAVALTYDAGRAGALVFRAPHRRAAQPSTKE